MFTSRQLLFTALFCLPAAGLRLYSQSAIKNATSKNTTSIGANTSRYNPNTVTTSTDQQWHQCFSKDPASSKSAGCSYPTAGGSCCKWCPWSVSCKSFWMGQSNNAFLQAFHNNDPSCSYQPKASWRLLDLKAQDTLMFDTCYRVEMFPVAAVQEWLYEDQRTISTSPASMRCDCSNDHTNSNAGAYSTARCFFYDQDKCSLNGKIIKAKALPTCVGSNCEPFDMTLRVEKMQETYFRTDEVNGGKCFKWDHGKNGMLTSAMTDDDATEFLKVNFRFEDNCKVNKNHPITRKEQTR